MLFIDPKLGGQVRISDDDYVTGPPEFAAEISSSSLAVDRGHEIAMTALGVMAMASLGTEPIRHSKAGRAMMRAIDHAEENIGED